MSDFKHGQTVYTPNGEAWSYVTPLAEMEGQHVVQPLYEDEYGETILGIARVIGTILAEPPTRIVDDAMAAAEKRLAEVNARVRAAQRQLRDTKANLDEMAALHAPVQRLKDFLDDRVTHVVMKLYNGVEIHTLDEALKTKDDRYSWDKKQRLLVLCGASQGDLSWHISHYSDGSGGLRRIWMATSLEQAQEIATAAVAEMLTEARKGAEFNNRPLYGSLIEQCDEYGVLVLHKERLAAWEASRSSLERKVTNARHTLDGAEKALAEHPPSPTP